VAVGQRGYQLVLSTYDHEVVKCNHYRPLFGPPEEVEEEAGKIDASTSESYPNV